MAWQGFLRRRPKSRAVGEYNYRVGVTASRHVLLQYTGMDSVSETPIVFEVVRRSGADLSIAWRMQPSMIAICPQVPGLPER